MKIVSIIGARPQFIKAAMISHAIRAHNSRFTSHESRLPAETSVAGTTNHESRTTNHDSRITELLVHTGQHYDYEMDRIFFEQLDIPVPHYYLNVGSGTHGDQTGRMLIEIEKVLLEEKPDMILVFGDTNSTLAGALASAKLNIPIGHVEAGMRSFNHSMPEEINRVVAGHVSKWHFCPTETAVANLKKEGILENVYLAGDVMHDSVLHYKKIADKNSTILERLDLLESIKKTPNSELRTKKYALATVHRAENTDDASRLKSILEALAEVSNKMPVVFPIHPRTKGAIDRHGLSSIIMDHKSVIPTEPLSYLDVLNLEDHAAVIVTDSGGVQKEAFWMGVPCVTMREETEWVETVEAGLNKIAGPDKDKIVYAVNSFMKEPVDRGNAVVRESGASEKIVNILVSGFSN